MPRTDVLIIGGGIVALTAAHSSRAEKNVIVITKSDVKASNSFHAKGGVAAAIHKDDHWRSHYEDTMLAGWLKKRIQRHVSEHNKISTGSRGVL